MPCEVGAGSLKLLTAVNLRPMKQFQESIGVTVLEHQDLFTPSLGWIQGNSLCSLGLMVSSGLCVKTFI